MLPYSREVLFSIIAEFNRQFAGLQILGFILTAALLYALLFRRQFLIRPVIAGLVCLWIASGTTWYFHLFAEIHFLAPFLGGVAILQGVLLLPTLFKAKIVDSKPSIFPLGILAIALAWPIFDFFLPEGSQAIRFAAPHPAPLILVTISAGVATLPGVHRLWLLPAVALSGVAAYEGWVLTIPQNLLLPVPVLAALLFTRSVAKSTDS